MGQGIKCGYVLAVENSSFCVCNNNTTDLARNSQFHHKNFPKIQQTGRSYAPLLNKNTHGGVPQFCG